MTTQSNAKLAKTCQEVGGQLTVLLALLIVVVPVFVAGAETFKMNTVESGYNGLMIGVTFADSEVVACG